MYFDLYFVLYFAFSNVNWNMVIFLGFHFEENSILSLK